MTNNKMPAVLIVAAEPDLAGDMSMRVRSAGYMAFAPKPDEDTGAAILRLRPTVILDQWGATATENARVDGVARSINARVIIFGEDSPALRETAKERGARSIAIDASTREIGAAIEAAARENVTG
jgi:hypothetical protein